MARACKALFAEDCTAEDGDIFIRRIASSEEQVRDMVSDLAAFLASRTDQDPLCERAQIVVAEVLNNVVEHAYGSDKSGDITTRVALCGRGACVTVRDTGRAMRNGRLPEGALPSSDGGLASLPEGGFGWFLIHELSECLSYERSQDTNVTRFVLPW